MKIFEYVCGYFASQKEAFNFLGAYWWVMDGSGVFPLILLVSNNYGWKITDDETVNMVVATVSIFWVVAVFVFGPFAGAYRKYLQTRGELEALKKPKIEIVGSVESRQGMYVSSQTHRIRAKNTSNLTVRRCRLRLMSSSPEVTNQPVTILLSMPIAKDDRSEVDLSPTDEELFILCETTDNQLFLRCKECISSMPLIAPVTLNFNLIGEDTAPLPLQVKIDRNTNPIVSLVDN